MKLGSVRYLEITTNHDVQSPFLHSWECELGMGAAAHCCSNLEIRAGEDWHFLLCYVSSHVFSSNQKQNRVISLTFAQIKPSLFHWLDQLQNSSLCLDWADSSSCRRVCDSAARCRENQHDTRHYATNQRWVRYFYILLLLSLSDKHTRGPNQQTIITRDEELRFINVFAGEARSDLERRDSQNRKSNLPWLGLEISLPSRKWGKYLSTDLMILDTKIKTQQRTGQLTANSKRFLQ